jgi:hypothetical protein
MTILDIMARLQVQLTFARESSSQISREREVRPVLNAFARVRRAITTQAILTRKMFANRERDVMSHHTHTTVFTHTQPHHTRDKTPPHTHAHMATRNTTSKVETDI